jgi:poly(3-hydroxybutyrate) depolymerase
LTAAAALTPQMLLKANDHEKLGDAVADYWKAKQEEKGIQESFELVAEARDKIQKRFARDLADGDLLSAVLDWEQIFYAATPIEEKGAKKGKVEDRVYEDPIFGEYPMAIHTPPKYSAKEGPVPLLIAIPPAGKKPEEHLAENWQDAVGLESAVIAVPEMPANQRTWAEIGSAENHGGIDTVLITLKAVKKTHAIDVNRVFLTGFGEGAAAAGRIGALYPHVFAGVAGRAGDLDDLPATNFRNLPSFFAGGGEKVAAFRGRAKEEGIENVTVNASASEADLWAWLLATHRAANPMDVSLAPLNIVNSQAYWLRVDGIDPDAAKIRAKIDRAANSVTIESSGISTATIYVNDLLLDLSKPVKVICNGSASEDLIPRNLRTMLDLASSSGDWGRVYVNANRYDIPVAK